MQTILYNMQYIYCICLVWTDNSISAFRYRFKLARVEKNFTQAELAEKVGVTRQTIGLIENGKYNPTINLCIAIADVLDKTLDELFRENSNDNR